MSGTSPSANVSDQQVGNDGTASVTATATAAAPPSGEAGGAGGGAGGEATLLVSEFPPPPFYYRQASILTAPPIPHTALERGTKRSAATAAKARAESERLRLGGDSQDAILAGTVGTSASGGIASSGGDDEEGSVVGVFGEIVEDPVLFQPLDRCEDPRLIRDEVKRLNNEAVKGFVELVKDLVHRPAENKKTRDELSHNVFLMLQECNKFREHQARETLIDLLEKELETRKSLLVEMKGSIAEADDLLSMNTS